MKPLSRNEISLLVKESILYFFPVEVITFSQHQDFFKLTELYFTQEPHKRFSLKGWNQLQLTRKSPSQIFEKKPTA